jgi:tRNA(fMet)-specific endonuclease VapC
MKLCLDTNAYTLFKANHRPLVELLESADEVFVPTIVVGELYAGFKIGSRTRQNMAELLVFFEAPGVSCVSVTLPVAERYGELVLWLRKEGTPIPTNDVWIAAIAFEAGARLVTYDKHFKNIAGLTIYSP